MLKRRLVLTLTFKDGVLFRTKRFIPDYRYTMNFVDGGADELVAIDVGEDRPAFWRAVEKLNDQCFLPLTVGGGIRSIDDVKEALRCGADKTLLERGAIEDPKLIPAIADKFGCQCAVLGVTTPMADPLGWATRGVTMGAGELFLQSVARDGSLGGYDLDLLRLILSAVNVPIVIGSGCGEWAHMKAAFELGASGCATSVIHHFSAAAIRDAKKYLTDGGVPVRP